MPKRYLAPSVLTCHDTQRPVTVHSLGKSLYANFALQSQWGCKEQILRSAVVSLKSKFWPWPKVLTGSTFKEYIERSFHGSKQRDDSAREAVNGNVKGAANNSVKA